MSPLFHPHTSSPTHSLTASQPRNHFLICLSVYPSIMEQTGVLVLLSLDESFCRTEGGGKQPKDERTHTIIYININRAPTGPLFFLFSLCQREISLRRLVFPTPQLFFPCSCVSPVLLGCCSGSCLSFICIFLRLRAERGKVKQFLLLLVSPTSTIQYWRSGAVALHCIAVTHTRLLTTCLLGHSYCI